MITRITPIKLNERSRTVANLHAAMQMLGFNVSASELNNQQVGETTMALVREFQKRMNITPKEEYLIDEATAEAMNKMLADQGLVLPDSRQACWVRGIVRAMGGGTARDLIVTAFDQDLRKREELGRTRTKNDGEYIIYYRLDQFQGAEQGGPDLVLEVSTVSGEVLHTSEVFFNAPATFNANITLTVLGTEAEFDRILRLVQPLTEGQDASINTLDENEKFRDISFLAGETDIARDRLTEFVIAHSWIIEGMPAEFWFAL